MGDGNSAIATDGETDGSDNVMKGVQPNLTHRVGSMENRYGSQYQDELTLPFDDEFRSRTANAGTTHADGAADGAISRDGRSDGGRVVAGRCHEPMIGDGGVDGTDKVSGDGEGGSRGDHSGGGGTTGTRRRGNPWRIAPNAPHKLTTYLPEHLYEWARGQAHAASRAGVATSIADILRLAVEQLRERGDDTVRRNRTGAEGSTSSQKRAGGIEP